MSEGGRVYLRLQLIHGRVLNRDAAAAIAHHVSVRAHSVTLEVPSDRLGRVALLLYPGQLPNYAEKYGLVSKRPNSHIDYF